VLSYQWSTTFNPLNGADRNEEQAAAALAQKEIKSI
jgi:hypothetical protein